MLSKVMTGLIATSLVLVGQTAEAGHGKKRWRGHDYASYGQRGPYSHDAEYDYARVIDVDPLVRRVRVTVPQRECYTETRYRTVDYGRDRGYTPYAPRSAAGSMILGSVIGAAVGNQIGRGDGRRAATVAGAIIGSAIGHDAAERRSGRYDDRDYDSRGYRDEEPYDVERCDVRYDERWEERIDGYRVTYVYNGRHSTTTLPYDPGERIRVRVNVRPDEEYCPD